jgi:hypothetical protein
MTFKMKLFNKKRIGLLLGFTFLTIIVSKVLYKPTISLEQVEKVSQMVNKELPQETTTGSLVKTEAFQNDKKQLYFKFYYRLNAYKNNIPETFLATEKYKLTESTCSNSLTKEILDNNIIVSYRYVTLDKEILPELQFSKNDCITKSK